MKESIKTIALAVSCTLTIATSTALGAALADKAELKSELANTRAQLVEEQKSHNISHLEEQNDELWGSVYNLIDIICDNKDESWRPMCEDRSWSLVVDEDF